MRSGALGLLGIFGSGSFALRAPPRGAVACNAPLWRLRGGADATIASVAATRRKKIAIGVVGPGALGEEFMLYIEATRRRLEQQGVEIIVAAVSEQKPDAFGTLKDWQICSQKSLSVADFKSALADPEAGEPGDLVKMSDFLLSQAPHAIVVDTTTSEEVGDMYPEWFGKGIHVVEHNKKVGSGDLARWKACIRAMERTGAQWGDECTVGSGLPILNLLRTDLLATGDRVSCIEGVLSGTLSYIFNTFKTGVAFSDVLREASDAGLTEPDPRDDLTGEDVARKVVNLARQCGMEIELSSVPVQSLVPQSLRDWQPIEGEVLAEAFVAQMKPFDEEMAALLAEAEAANAVLRFVGVIDVAQGKVSVELRQYPKTHAFAGTQHADNMIAFHTERYTPRPLVVQGPGAGVAVTAAGLYAEVLRIAKSC